MTPIAATEITERWHLASQGLKMTHARTFFALFRIAAAGDDGILRSKLRDKGHAPCRRTMIKWQTAGIITIQVQRQHRRDADIYRITTKAKKVFNLL